MSDRGSDGRFTKGNRASPGRPRREVEQEYRNATLGKVPLTRWRKIVARAVDDAEVGDAKARSWLTDILGLRPPARIAETTSDGDDMTLGRLLTTLAERGDREPDNIVDVDREYERHVAEAEAAAAQPAADTSGATAELPDDAAVIDVAPDGAVTYSAADDDREAE